jgi:hypothetical protein
MPCCATCEETIDVAGQWLELCHHYPNMSFDSAFCSVACATAYLTEDLKRGDGGT